VDHRTALEVKPQMDNNLQKVIINNDLFNAPEDYNQVRVGMWTNVMIG